MQVHLVLQAGRLEFQVKPVDLAEVVLAYVEHLERAGELDLEAATEFLVLIAALLELKSRLMLPVEDGEELDLEPREAAEELLARMLEYHRYRGAAQHIRALLEAEHGFRYRSAPLPPALRRVSIEGAETAYEPEQLAAALRMDGLVATTRQNLGYVAALRGDLPAALTWFDRADAWFRANGTVDAVGLRDRCEALLPAGLVVEARQAAEEAVHHLARLRQASSLAEARLLLSEAALRDGDPGTAKAEADRARGGV